MNWTAYITAIAAPVIALIAAWIAFRQSQIARNKLKLDLFDKRMAIYQQVSDTLSAIFLRGSLTIEEQAKYLNSIGPSRWLFGPRVHTYLSEMLWNQFMEFEQFDSKNSESPGAPEMFPRNVRGERILWVLEQSKTFDSLVENHLTIKH